MSKDNYTLETFVENLTSDEANRLTIAILNTAKKYGVEVDINTLRPKTQNNPTL